MVTQRWSEVQSMKWMALMRLEGCRCAFKRHLMPLSVNKVRLKWRYDQEQNKKKCGKIKRAVSKRSKDDLQRHNIPSALINAASFVHPRFRPHAGSSIQKPYSNIQWFPPSISISEACVREKTVVFVRHKSTQQNTDVSWVSHPLWSAVLAQLL